MPKQSFKRGQPVWINSELEETLPKRGVVLRKDLDDIYDIINIDGEYSGSELGKYLTPRRGVFWKIFTSKTEDLYTAMVAVKGNQSILTMGCRYFTSLADALKHWSNGKDGHYAKMFGGASLIHKTRLEANKSHAKTIRRLYKKAKGI